MKIVITIDFTTTKLTTLNGLEHSRLCSKPTSHPKSAENRGWRQGTQWSKGLVTPKGCKSTCHHRIQKKNTRNLEMFFDNYIGYIDINGKYQIRNHMKSWTHDISKKNMGNSTFTKRYKVGVFSVHRHETNNPQNHGVTIGSLGDTGGQNISRTHAKFMSSSGFGDTKGCLHVKITWMGLQDTGENTNRTNLSPTHLAASIKFLCCFFALKPSKWGTVYPPKWDDLGPPHWPRVFTVYDTHIYGFAVKHHTVIQKTNGANHQFSNEVGVSGIDNFWTIHVCCHLQQSFLKNQVWCLSACIPVILYHHMSYITTYVLWYVCNCFAWVIYIYICI